VLTGLFTGWFAEHTAAEIHAALSATSLLWDRYRSFSEVADDARLHANAMFAPLHQPRVGDYLAAGLPTSIDGNHPPPVAAPALGGHTVSVLQERLGVSEAEIDRLVQSGTVATG
jgi:2-methylfumaryl-CoA isomerase